MLLGAPRSQIAITPVSAVKYNAIFHMMIITELETTEYVLSDYMVVLRTDFQG
jgi:hypothetical protein